MTDHAIHGARGADGKPGIGETALFVPSVVRPVLPSATHADLSRDLARIFDRLDATVVRLQESMLRLPHPLQLGRADPGEVELQRFHLTRVRLEVALREAAEAAGKLEGLCERITRREYGGGR